MPARLSARATAPRPTARPTTAIVPLRSLGAGKTRLASRLTAAQRAALARAMFVDVVAALRTSEVDEVVVATGDAAAAALGEQLGLRVTVDPSTTTGLDAAIRAATEAVGDVPGLLIVAADLPTLRGEDIDAVVACDAPVVVAPTRDGGTGALLRRPARAISTAYGLGSAERHLALARDAGLTPATIEREGLRRDVDTWTDLVGLRPAEVGRATGALLPELFAAV